MHTATSRVTPPCTPAARRALAAFRLAVAGLLLAGCAAQAPRPAVTGAASPAAASGAPAVDLAQPVPVALLLPLASSRSADQAIARDMEDAARLAASPAIALTVHPTAASADSAAEAVGRAAAEGAAALIGPAFAEEATGAGPAVRSRGITTLAFTPIAAAGAPPLYVLGLGPEPEVRRILSYAASQGLRRVALLYPEELYGTLVRDAAVAAAPLSGVDLVDVTGYPRRFEAVESIMREAAPRIAAAVPDAILIADRDQALVAVAAFLGSAGLTSDRVQYLGLSYWEVGRALRDPSLDRGWYPTVDPAARDAFVAGFTERYGRAPDPRAAVAFDAATVLSDLVAQARRTGAANPFAPEALTSPAGFSGATGRFRLTPQGTATRDLAIMEVTRGGPVLRAPAAPSGS